MRDIPVFTTSAGVASLTLKEIPYKGSAYVRLQDTGEPELLLQDCIDFCRAAGAEHIYATGHEMLEKYPIHTAIWRLSCLKDSLPQTDAAIFPVQDRTLEKWRQIYNERMKHVPNAATMTVFDGQEMLKKGDGYFIHREQTLLGIGKASGDTIDAVVSVIPGSGEDVLLALCNALSGDRVTVEVASANIRALKLYNRLGFIQTEEIATWYKII